MQSSYSIIKGNSVDMVEEKNIKTNYESKNIIEIDDEAEIVRVKESLESMRKSILGNIKIEKEKIIKAAYITAAKIEKETYEKAYKEGLANGREDGYKAAFDENIKEAKELVASAMKVLHDSKVEYENYVEVKRDEILDLAYNISEHILERELTRDDGLNNFIIKVIKDSRESKSFVIRCNAAQVDSIKESLNKEKDKFGLKAELYFVIDEEISTGNVCIDFDKGSVTVGTKNALESIKKEIF